MITLSCEELLKLANEALQREPWAKSNMVITQVEQKHSTLVFFGKGFHSEDNFEALRRLRNLDKLANMLAKNYRMAE